MIHWRESYSVKDVEQVIINKMKVQPDNHDKFQALPVTQTSQTAGYPPNYNNSSHCSYNK